MNVEDLSKIVIAPITEPLQIHIGTVKQDGSGFLDHRDITREALGAVMAFVGPNKFIELKVGEGKYRITVQEIDEKVPEKSLIVSAN